MSKAYINGEVPRASSRAMFREMEEEEGTRDAAAVVAALQINGRNLPRAAAEKVCLIALGRFICCYSTNL